MSKKDRKIKIVTVKKVGNLFHYPHFIMDCLFPEIIDGIHEYGEVYREKTIKKTLGVFDKIYAEIMDIKYTELPKEDFEKVDAETFVMDVTKIKYTDKIYFYQFSDFIFSRYNIDPTIYDPKYPEVILIKRASEAVLVEDLNLKNELYQLYLERIKITENHSPISKARNPYLSGKERREIEDIDKVEDFLKQKYQDKFESIFLESMPFEEQVRYFNNAKIIICAHGGALTNLFFCKPNTKIVEVTCGCESLENIYDQLSSSYNLRHYKCHENSFNSVVNFINEVL